MAGISASDLYRVLRSQGVPGLVDPAAPAVSMQSPSNPGCYAYYSWNSANTLCPLSHWANNGYGHPQVYFVDRTGANWPTDVSTYTWNQAQGIDSTYVWWNCPGYGGTHCVTVNDANYGNSCWQGLTYVPVDGNGNFVDGQVNIYLNDYNGGGTCNGYGVNYAKNYYGYRQDVCHEQGHALGLDHNSSTNSCIYSTIINSSGAQKPNSDDFSLMQWIYSSRH